MFKGTRLGKVLGLAAGLGALMVSGPASALTTADRPASILIWTDIVFDSANSVDTLVQLSNTSTTNLKQAHCYYINANSHCSDNPAQVCQVGADCNTGASCDQGWNEIDFNVVLTADQPLGWYAGSGTVTSRSAAAGFRSM